MTTELLDENRVEESYEKRLAIFYKLFEDRLSLLAKTLRAKRADADILELLVEYLNSLKSRVIDALPDKAEEISSLAESTKADLLNQEPNQQISLVSHRLSEFFAKNMSLSKFEELSRQGRDLLTNFESSKSIMLNRLLMYRLDGENVIIDIPTTFIEKPVELIKLFKDGMKKMAKLLQGDPNLERATRIIGYSWMVSVSPEIVEKLGLRIIDGSSAEISKGKLIELYGN